MNIASIPKASRLAPYISARHLCPEIDGGDEHDDQVSEQNPDPEILVLQHLRFLPQMIELMNRNTAHSMTRRTRR